MYHIHEFPWILWKARDIYFKYTILFVKKINIDISGLDSIILELDETICPNTIAEIMKNLPFTVGIHIWGDELYTDETPINSKKENAKDLVELYDVAYWPPGRAICLFYGSTPIGNKGEIKPYSAVNVIGKIINPDNKIISKIKDGTSVTFNKN